MKNIEQYRNRFNSLLESTMGDVRPLISEQDDVTTQTANYDKNYFVTKKTGAVSFDNYGFPVTVDGVEITDYDTQWRNNFSVKNIGGRGFQGGDFTWTYGDKVATGVMGPNEFKPGISIKDNSGQEVGTLLF